MFDLEKAIARWRRSLAQRGGFSAEDLEELEGHVRDHVEAQRVRGGSDREAFYAAVNRLGDPEAVSSEYRKVAWKKVRARRGLLRSIGIEAAMLANYVKIGLRNLVRQRVYAAVNITGLAVGLATCLLIAIYVRYEWSFDRHHEKADRIYRVAREWKDAGGRRVLALARISLPIGPAMERELPEVERAVRLLEVDGPVSVDDKRFVERSIFVADSGFFDIFSAPLIRGNADRALVEPNAVVLTERMARKYFGTQDPLGRTVRVLDQLDLTVTGVMRPQPPAAHFHPDFLISFPTIRPWIDASEENEWGQYNNYGTYVLLSKDADARALAAKLPSFLRSHYRPDNNTEDVLLLQPLTGIHLSSHLDAEFEPNGNRNYVILFIAVAVLVLVVACFNFINLATARASYRGKEVGMRKVMGAERRQLVLQFLGESLVLTLIALLVAVGIVWVVMPVFAKLGGQSLAWSQLSAVDVLIAVVGVVVTVSIMAGVYPAVFLSRFQPADVFRRSIGGSWRSGLRSTLVVSQFAISIILIVGVGVVLRQMSYIQHKDLGFDKEHLVVLPMTPEMTADFERFRTQLESSPAIEHVTASKLVPSGALVDHVGVRAEVRGEMREASLALNPVDHDFLETYGMRLAAGRSFSKELSSDSTEAFIINEAAVDLLGWSSAEEAVGKPFVMEARSFTRPGSVVGVVKDFHFESLRNRIAPLVLFIMPERWRQVTVRIAATRLEEGLHLLEARWKIYRPDFPFTYSFVDEDFGALYEADRRVGTLFGYFSMLALVIATLGLLGLATFVMERRRKEIGVRKVLGATVARIVRMLTFDFLRLIGLAFVIACPIAYLIGTWWLERFAYRSDLAVSLFFMAGAAVAAAALATISLQSIKTALADPVMSLKHE